MELIVSKYMIFNEQHVGYSLIIYVIAIGILILIGKTLFSGKQQSRSRKYDQNSWLLAEYKWEPGALYPCKVLGVENEKIGTYTVLFYWGCLQPSTSQDQIRWDSAVEPPAIPNDDDKDKCTIDISDTAEKYDNIWIAARRGDIDVVRRLAKNMEDVNALEPVGSKSHDGRSALYWACLTGRVDVVELLLDLGAKDVDGSAFQAATCSDPVRAKHDQRDLLFDPDANVFTDNVVREIVSLTDGSDAKSRKIRALLAASRSDGLVPLPTAVFDRPTLYCCVCYESFSVKPPAVCNPCGHSSTCWPCLKKIRKDRTSGCPECRSRIREIIPLVDVPDQ
jgi:hypothetical protein